METTQARPKPFANCKPRSEWKHPVRKLRRWQEVQFGVGNDGRPVFKLVEFRLAREGLVVRLKHARKRTVWEYGKLANGVGGGQMKLL